MTTNLNGYPARYSQTDLDALSKKAVVDFAVGLVYYVPRAIGREDTSATTVPVYTEKYVLDKRTVAELTINNDLLDFQDAVRRGIAYATDPRDTTTIPATTTAGS